MFELLWNPENMIYSEQMWTQTAVETRLHQWVQAICWNTRTFWFSVQMLADMNR